MTIARAAKLTQRKAIPYVAREAAKLLNGQAERIIARAERGATFELLFPSHEALWQQAIDSVMAEAGIEVVTSLVPPIQSVMAQAYARVGIMLGHKVGNTDVNANIAREARTIASKITRINETTRNQFVTVVRNSISDGLTVTETAKAIRDKMPEINFGRSLTIARTELNNSWTQGAIQSFKESKTISEVSVIGCEAREENSPQFRGESTCNIEGVSITDIDELNAVGWHVNHSGTLICSAFRDQ